MLSWYTFSMSENPTPGTTQRADGLWHPKLNNDVLPAMYDDEATALWAARKRLHSWWHRPNALDLKEYPMDNCEDCK